MREENKSYRFKFIVRYDGTNYAGWQKQPSVLTIQQEIESCFKRLFGIEITIHAASRTDQGVHARCQVFHCDLPAERVLTNQKLCAKLNAVLPHDIRIVSCCKVCRDFHARYSAKAKEYRYFIWNASFVPPEKRFFYLWISKKLSIKLMQDAAKNLIGKHDFSAFSANPNRHVESYVREIKKITIKKHGAEIIICINGSGFLYKMARSIVGYLIRVGEGALDPLDGKDIILSHKRTARVPTAPPHGLFLWQVFY